MKNGRMGSLDDPGCPLLLRKGESMLHVEGRTGIFLLLAAAALAAAAWVFTGSEKVQAQDFTEPCWDVVFGEMIVSSTETSFLSSSADPTAILINRCTGATWEKRGRRWSPLAREQ